MVPKQIPVEVVEASIAAVAGGEPFVVVAARGGVSRSSVTRWWEASSPVRVEIAVGRRGGLAGTPAPDQVPSQVPGAGRCRRALSVEERMSIAVGVEQRWSLARIGRMIGRDKSVVCREVARNTGPDGRYRPLVAHRAAHERRRRPKTFKLIEDPALCRRIEAWMDEGWSPKLIARVLAEQHVDEQAGQQVVGAGRDCRMGRVEPVEPVTPPSHETIYKALYVQSRGALRKDLYRQLSTARPRRKPHAGARRSSSPYREAFTISQRPAVVEDRAVPGHWEGDLIMGTTGGVAVGTLVERSTRYTMLLHLPGRHDADSVAKAMIAEMAQLPEHLRQSLTWDRGTELARYDQIQLALQMPVYFCDPHSPWQRGTNENTNRLLRHWLTKGTDLAHFSAADLRRIAASLNARPRPTLDMQTPAQALEQLLANPPAAPTVATTD